MSFLVSQMFPGTLMLIPLYIIIVKWLHLGSSYLGLVLAVVILARAAHLLTPFWGSVVALMLVGYLAAPHFIFRLCVATHEGDHEETQTAPLS